MFFPVTRSRWQVTNQTIHFARKKKSPSFKFQIQLEIDILKAICYLDYPPLYASFHSESYANETKMVPNIHTDVSSRLS